MTTMLAPSSPRKPAARQFGRELARAMEQHRVGTRSVARMAGVGRTAVIHWLNGESFPRYDSALALAEALSWPALTRIADETRRGLCPECGRSWLNEGGNRKVYCSESCREASYRRRIGHRTTFDVLERRLTEHIAAIEAFCRGCEPEGLCRDADCLIRPISPLPLSRRNGW